MNFQRKKKREIWYVKLKVCEIPIIFLIDTGTDIDVISTKTFRKLRKRPMLKVTHGIYKSPRATLTCKGKFWMNSMHRNKIYHFEIHVIDNNTDNLLSRDTAFKMRQVTLVANVNGCMEGDPVKITRKCGAILHTNSQAYTLPNLIQGKKKELQRLHEDDIITKPTHWCSLIVPARKKAQISGYA